MMSSESWKIASMPFVWSPLSSPKNGDDLPDNLPFELAFDEQTGLVIQRPNAEVQDALAVAYRKGSILTGLMDEDGIGRSYADDFLSFIARSIQCQEFSGLRILEIGCGNGYLLKRLRDAGAEVLGIEPGEHGQNGGDIWNVPIVHGFFPHESVQGEFDLVIAFGVLEHVENPQAFLSLIKFNLKPSGKVIIGVPDESPYILHGDVSTLFHEHWSFFDAQTLSSTVRLAGYKELQIEQSGYGGSLYCTMQIVQETTLPLAAVTADSVNRARNYIREAQSNCQKFAEYCERIFEQNKTLGIYVPSRVVNVLAIANIPLKKIRFFDDNSALYGSFYPGMDIPVENRQQLIAAPTDYVLVMSRTFGDRLAQGLRETLPKSIEIRTVSEILG